MRTSLAAIFAAFVFAGPVASQAPARTPEQEVLESIIRRHAPNRVLVDSTWAHPCERGCGTPEGVPAEAWSQYLERTRQPEPLAPHLPPGLDVSFVSERAPDALLPCNQRARTLRVSRGGVSADGGTAVVHYDLWIPVRHTGGCGVTTGATGLFRRSASGVWTEVRRLGWYTS